MIESAKLADFEYKALAEDHDDHTERGSEDCLLCEAREHLAASQALVAELSAALAVMLSAVAYLDKHRAYIDERDDARAALARAKGVR